MKIGLHDSDRTGFPNLALMKLSAWHKGQGDTVEWWSPLITYDKVYSSKVFILRLNAHTYRRIRSKAERAMEYIRSWLRKLTRLIQTTQYIQNVITPSDSLLADVFGIAHGALFRVKKGRFAHIEHGKKSYERTAEILYSWTIMY